KFEYMKIKNKKNNANYVNYKFDGFAKKILIPAGGMVNVPEINNVNQILNIGDFNRGFFEVVKDEPKPAKAVATKALSKKKKEEDALDKVKKEVKNYTDNEE